MQIRLTILYIASQTSNHRPSGNQEQSKVLFIDYELHSTRCLAIHTFRDEDHLLGSFLTGICSISTLGTDPHVSLMDNSATLGTALVVGSSAGRLVMEKLEVELREVGTVGIDRVW